MTIATALLFSAALVLRPDADHRLYNPGRAAVDATLTCAGTGRALRVGPGEVVDVPAAGCTSLTGALVAVETYGDREQRVVEHTACDTEPMVAPLFGCKGGTATAAVRVLDGATYAWTAEGASIVSGAGTSRVTVALPQSGNATLSCVITTSECSQLAKAVIAVRDPLVIGALTVPESANANESTTITWSYSAGTPVSQVLTGDAFPAPVTLAASARSYTFTPRVTGTKSVELHASYQAAISTAPARAGRRRASSGSSVSATECSAVSAAKTLLVTGCIRTEPFILAPTVIDADATFNVNVDDMGAGETAEWSVDNGTLVASDAAAGTATIRAGESGEVRVGVRLTTADRCERAWATRVAIIPAAKPCADPPVANLVYETHDCDRAVVRVTFTGQPPYRGTWSDGTSFDTHAPSLTHEFRQPGTYSITSFRNATCLGVVSGSARVDSFRARAELKVEGGACTTGKLVATLHGTPPFDVLWSDHTWVRTNEHVLERRPSEAGTWFIEAVQDARCKVSSPTPPIQIQTAPRASLSAGPVCQFYDGDPARIFLYFPYAYGGPPYVVKWADGAVTQSDSPYLYRQVPKPTVRMQPYEVVSATAGDCEAEMDNRLTHVDFRPPPYLNTLYKTTVCVGEVSTMNLRQMPADGAMLEWSIPGAEIVSGQGTGTVAFRAVTAGNHLARVRATYPDGACETFDQGMIHFRTTFTIDDFTVAPSTIRKGGKATLTFTRNPGMEAWGIHVNTAGRYGDLNATPKCTATTCTYEYTDTVGEGTVEFQLEYWAPCFRSPQKTAPVTLTITP